MRRKEPMKLHKIEKVMLAIVAVSFIFSLGMAYASGLGTAYVANGYVSCQVVSNPHNDSHQWGYVDQDGNEVTLGYTDEIGTPQEVGYFENESIIFWADGRNKRFFTGHGNKETDHTQFVINGVKFQISIEEDAGAPMIMAAEAQMKTEGAYDETSCVDYSIPYEQVRIDDLQAFWSSSMGINLMRLQMSSYAIDWTLFKAGTVTVEVMLNDDCEYTWSTTDTIEYFEIPAKRFKGYRLTDYDYPTAGMYAGKLRVTNERGVNKHYVYINKVNVHPLVGSNVNVKVALYQDGELIQAFEGSKVMTQTIN